MSPNTVLILLKILIMQFHLATVTCQYENSNYGYYTSYPGYYDYSQCYQYSQSGSYIPYTVPYNHQYSSTSYEAPQQLQSIVIINRDSKEDDDDYRCNCRYEETEPILVPYPEPVLIPYPVPVPIETNCNFEYPQDCRDHHEPRRYESDCDYEYERRIKSYDSPNDRYFTIVNDDYYPSCREDVYEYSGCPSFKICDGGCESRRSRKNCKKCSEGCNKRRKDYKHCDRLERRRYRD